MNERILLAGATGYIGSAVALELTKRGHDVVGLVRSNSARPNAEEVNQALANVTKEEVDLGNPEAVRAVLRRHRCTSVVSCLASRSGTAGEAEAVDYAANRNLLEATRESPADRFVLLSAICVQKPRLAFQFAKLKFEKALSDSGVPYSVVRPTAYFKSLAGQIERVRRGRPFLFFDGGLRTACKPISARDVAVVLADEATRVGESRLLPVGGPGPALTAKDQGTLLFQALGREPRFRSVPSGIFKVVAGLLKPLEPVSQRMAEKAELARIGHYYATESMLVWDARTRSYDAAATPSTGSDTLGDFYRQAAKGGVKGQSLGAQRVF